MRRRTRIAAGTAALLLLGTGGGILVGRHEAAAAPVVAYYDIPPLPGRCGPSPVSIAALADLHVSARPTPPAAVMRVVETLNALHPDYVVLVGDYLGHDWPREPGAIATAIAPLARLRPRKGSVAVLGNNDWQDGPAMIAAALRGVGIPVLSNDAWMAPDVTFMGVEEIVSNTANPVLVQERLATAAAVARRTPPPIQIWLAHQPAMFDRLGTTGTLLVTGHTHGGQILPSIAGPIARTLIRMMAMLGIEASWPAQTYVRGLYRHGDERMLITSGIGTSGPSMRLGVPPEVALIRIAACRKPDR